MASIYDYKVKKRDGKVVGRFGPTDQPKEMEIKIKELI